MLIVSMGVSVDGFINDREGGIGWGGPGDEQFAFHTEEIRRLGGCLLGRRLYETMVPWETDPSMRQTDAMREFAELWSAIPKVVFSRTLDRVEGNARLAEGSLADEAARMAADADEIEVGGAGLAASAIELGLVEEFRMFRYPVILGGGTPYLPPVDRPIALELVP